MANAGGASTEASMEICSTLPIRLKTGMPSSLTYHHIDIYQYDTYSHSISIVQEVQE